MEITHLLKRRRPVITVIRACHPYPISLSETLNLRPYLLDDASGLSPANPGERVDAETVGHAFPIDRIEADGFVPDQHFLGRYPRARPVVRESIRAAFSWEYDSSGVICWLRSLLWWLCGLPCLARALTVDEEDQAGDRKGCQEYGGTHEA